MAKNLRADIVDLGVATLRSGTVDPSAGAGVSAPEGTLFLRHVSGAGELWVKTGPADTDWEIPTGGDPNVNANAWSDPVNPSADDDEFTASALSGWRRYNSDTSSTWTPSASPIDPAARFTTGSPRESINDRRPNWLEVQPPADGDFRWYDKPITPLADGNFIWIRCSTQREDNGTISMDNNNGNIGLRVWEDDGAGEPDNGERISVFANVDSGDVFPALQVNEGGSQVAFTNSTNVKAVNAYFGLLVSNSQRTFHAFWSRQGRGWTFIDSYTFASSKTYEHVGLFYNLNQNDYAGNIVFGFDFMRIDDLGRPLG